MSSMDALVLAVGGAAIISNIALIIELHRRRS